MARRRQLDPGQPVGREGRWEKVESEPTDHALGRSRGGFGIKVHLVVSADGVPISAVVTAGQVHESKAAIAGVRPRRLAGDKGSATAGSAAT